MNTIKFQLIFNGNVGTVSLIRYIIKRTRKISFDENVEQIQYCDSAERRDEMIAQFKERGITDYTVTEIDQTGNEWAEGLEFANWNEANAALETGEDKWKASRPPTFEELCERVENLETVLAPVVQAAVLGGSVTDSVVVDAAVSLGLITKKQAKEIKGA